MKTKITYEGMPFDHVNNKLKILKNYCQNIKTQPNVFYIDGEIDINAIMSKCEFLLNSKIESYDEITGLTYDACKQKILDMLSAYDILNLNIILHKNACLYINPKELVFDLNTMNLPVDVIISVLNEQLIFFTSDHKCVFLCENNCNPDVNSIQLVLNGRLYDRVIAIERDLKGFDAGDYVNNIIMDLCGKMNANEVLCKHVYYDRNSRTVGEDLFLMGTISAIKFSDNRLREIHKDGVCNEEVMVVKCIIHLANLLMYELPSGNLDPFGVKKSADFIVNYAINNSMNMPVMTNEIDAFLIKRLINKIKGSDLLLCKSIDWKNIYKDKDIMLNMDAIKRIMKLARKSNPTDTVMLTDGELILMNSVNTMTYGNINDVVNMFIEYIDNNKVGLYIERINLLKSLVNKIECTINIK